MAKKIQEIADNIQNSVFKRGAPSTLDEVPSADPKVLIPSGSIVLNLACSDTANGAYLPGHMANLIGDSSTGKTYLALSMLAEIAHNALFDDYRLIFDDVEQANEFDIPRQFGTKLADRLEPPGYEKEEEDEPKYSDTVQDFQIHIDDAVNDGRPFIYVLDSLDALTSRAEQQLVEENLNKIRKGTQEAGSYGTDKPKALSQFLRLIVTKIKKTKSFILVISQTRDNISSMSFNQKTRSGGRALKFYCSHEIWLAEGAPEKKKERTVGKLIHAKVTKNKLTGKVREVQFPIYNEYGIDDIGACIGLLVKDGPWKKSGDAKGPLTGSIVISGIEEFLGIEKCTRDKLIREVEANKKHRELFQLAEKVWLETEASLSLGRVAKFESSSSGDMMGSIADSLSVEELLRQQTMITAGSG